MESLGSFLFVLVAGAVMLINYLLQKARSRGWHADKRAPLPDEEPQRDVEAELEQAEAQAQARAQALSPRVSPRSASRTSRLSGTRISAPPAVARIPARRLLTGRENLRRAVIAMTVLGPPVSERPKASLPGS